ncbi:MAG: 16S rRNA (uracil(1498)-N(3))-methyltransferase [Gammaproteobacteria bacterium]
MKKKNRRTSRIFLDADLEPDRAELGADRAHYLRSVLRQQTGDTVVVFNGKGTERNAVIEMISRDRATLSLTDRLTPLVESGLRIVLLQALVKSDAMDLILQKSVELGVHEIVPVETEFSVVKLTDERASRRVAHWQKIAISACEQCGRHRPPVISRPGSLAASLASLDDNAQRIALHVNGSTDLAHTLPGGSETRTIALLIGPEGGLSESDLKHAKTAKFEIATLGPRILRSETAALAACAILQSGWGDLSD